MFLKRLFRPPSKLRLCERSAAFVSGPAPCESLGSQSYWFRADLSAARDTNVIGFNAPVDPYPTLDLLRRACVLACEMLATDDGEDDPCPMGKRRRFCAAARWLFACSGARGELTGRPEGPASPIAESASVWALAVNGPAARKSGRRNSNKSAGSCAGTREQRPLLLSLRMVCNGRMHHVWLACRLLHGASWPCRRCFSRP